MTETGFVVRKTYQNSGLFRNKQPLLSHLDIELTERCNNNCLHCYINLPEDDHKAASRELDTEGWKRILNEASDLGTLSVRFTGGEPLLREDFAEIYLHARHLGMKVMLFTNARLITAEFIELFSKVPPLEPIEISVYGMHAESYDKVACTPRAFSEFRQGIDRLLNHKIFFMVKSVLLPPNLDEMNEYQTWAATIPYMNEPKFLISFVLRTRRDSPAKNRLIRSLRLSPEEIINFFTKQEDSYRQGMIPFAASFMHPQGDRLFDCSAGETGCVDAYGKYQVCMLLRHPDTVYDLTKGTLQEALTEVFPRIRELRAKNPDYLKRCARCFLKGLCEQCPAKSWSEHGTLDTPVEYLCEVAHTQARFLGLLSEGEYAWEINNWRSRIEKFVNPTKDLNEKVITQHEIPNCKGSR